MLLAEMGFSILDAVVVEITEQEISLQMFSSVMMDGQFWARIILFVRLLFIPAYIFPTKYF